MGKSAAELVDDHLRDERERNSSQKIWPSHNTVIERLRQDKQNLSGAWAELLEQLPSGQKPVDRICDKWQMVVDTIVEVAAGWSPTKVTITRNAIQEVDILTSEIQRKAQELAKLLRRRTSLCETNAISKKPMDFHPMDLLDQAAKIADSNGSLYGNTHYLFSHHLKAPLHDLTSQFDLKYWPRTADFVEAIAEVQGSTVFSNLRLSESAMASRQGSWRDFMRAFDAALEDLGRSDVAVKFSYKSSAAIVNAALGLDQEVSKEDISAYRYGERKKNG